MRAWTEKEKAFYISESEKNLILLWRRCPEWHTAVIKMLNDVVSRKEPETTGKSKFTVVRP